MRREKKFQLLSSLSILFFFTGKKKKVKFNYTPHPNGLTQKGRLFMLSSHGSNREGYVVPHGFQKENFSKPYLEGPFVMPPRFAFSFFCSTSFFPRLLYEAQEKKNEVEQKKENWDIRV